jgi:hypothetical protein
VTNVIRSKGMQDKLEQLEAVVIDAYRGHKEQQRRQQTWMGLIPGEPIDGEELAREQLEEQLAA